MKKLIKKTLRTGVRKIKNFVKDEPVSRQPDFSKSRSIYSQLTWIMDQAVRASNGALRPNYTWGVLHAGHMAKSLGVPRISVMEFGVAGGNGLVALEHAADLVEKQIGTKIDVYGFDTGVGLPKTRDYRDLPSLYPEGGYRMDVPALKARLTRAKLILGDVAETLPDFQESKPAPVGFMSIDVDYYTSTQAVLKLLDSSTDILMPRIHCHFDDILGPTCSEYTGERLAMNEFNADHEQRKISPIYGFKHLLIPPHSHQEWVEQAFIAHIFDHELYCKDDGVVVDRSGSKCALKPVYAAA